MVKCICLWKVYGMFRCVGVIKSVFCFVYDILSLKLVVVIVIIL